ncbi:MAG: RnfABCDGE type electron transport complex subunit D [Gammaproteobacteria bacterium]|nr:MAG: RnfABCDGE type electron transport complex subunit D [Gammaproteobacteria bacterium]
MPFQMIAAPHLRGPNTTSKYMFKVVIGLIPGIIAATYFFGWGVLTNIVVANIAALLFETIALKLRKHSLKKYLTDGSAIVTATLLGIAIPQLSAWWLPVVGVFMAIVIAKHLYGGLGYNPFNPAAIGYVVLLISFPKEMSQWATPDWLGPVSPDKLSFAETLGIVFCNTIPDTTSLDLLTHASPLDFLKGQLKLGLEIPQIIGKDPEMWGSFAGKGWEWMNVALLIGGLYMIWKKVITWHIPVGMLGSILILSAIVYVISPETAVNPIYHIFSGGIMLGAFFIATDPVTSCTSVKGRLFFGIGAGALTYIIRTWGGYPDGIAFAVLLMNLSAPYIDRFTIPTIYGAKKAEK